MSDHPCELLPVLGTVPSDLQLDREPVNQFFGGAPFDARLPCRLVARRDYVSRDSLEPSLGYASPGGGTSTERGEMTRHLVNRSATKTGGAVHMLPRYPSDARGQHHSGQPLYIVKPSHRRRPSYAMAISPRPRCGQGPFCGRKRLYPRGSGRRVATEPAELPKELDDVLHENERRESNEANREVAQEGQEDRASCGVRDTRNRPSSRYSLANLWRHGPMLRPSGELSLNQVARLSSSCPCRVKQTWREPQLSKRWASVPLCPQAKGRRSAPSALLGRNRHRV